MLYVACKSINIKIIETTNISKMSFEGGDVFLTKMFNKQGSSPCPVGELEKFWK